MDRMYDELLVPTDGSPASEAAVEHAIVVAKRFDARVHALYVVDATAYSALDSGTDTVVQSLEQEGQEAVATVIDAAEAADLPTETAIVSGTAYRSILEYANNAEIDLIVMGTHGRQGLDRYLLGSVTERVVRSADPPVLTVRMQDGD